MTIYDAMFLLAMVAAIGVILIAARRRYNRDHYE